MSSPPLIIDCHCHLAAVEFNEDIDVIVASARAAGVGAIVVVPESSREFQRVLDTGKRFGDIAAPCFGVHPVQEDPDTAEGGGIPEESARTQIMPVQRSVHTTDIQSVAEYIDSNLEQLVGIGEIGLDFTPRVCSREDRDEQMSVFKTQIELAKRFDLPVNVHSRSASKQVIGMLRDLGVSKALLHAFDGRPSTALEGVSLGYYFSVPPSIVRSEQKQKLVARIPLENLCLETDSPALGPVKGCRNEPSNLRISCEQIARIKGVSYETVAKVTTKNALKLFPKLCKFIL